ncbi:hypothetical protein Peur_071579 [Populus x canadensis]
MDKKLQRKREKNRRNGTWFQTRDSPLTKKTPKQNIKQIKEKSKNPSAVPCLLFLFSWVTPFLCFQKERSFECPLLLLLPLEHSTLYSFFISPFLVISYYTH